MDVLVLVLRRHCTEEGAIAPTALVLVNKCKKLDSQILVGRRENQ